MPISDNAATFLGISNENEFYSAHYLAEVFKGDINEVLTAWKEREESEEGYHAPNNRLKALARDYFAMRERSQRERNHKKATDMQREFFRQLCGVLDIPWQPHNRRVTSDKPKDDLELPVLVAVPNNDAPKLLVLGALDVEKEGIDPLLLELKRDQFIGEGPHADNLKNTSWYELINTIVFKQEDPPRWVLLLSDRQCILIDRYKWLQNRLLRFDWDEVLGRKDDVTLKATAALLHQKSLVPEQGGSLLDNLDENSHKHAFGVSEDLKYALRESIELLGNEAAQQLIQIPGINFTGKSALDADELSRECLRYMYRLLFLFYIEARPELNYVPHESEAYRKGYSLETLRNLELVKLTTDESRKGSYLHQSINRLFRLIHEGYQGEHSEDLADQGSEQKLHNTFTLDKLDSHLFDPKQTPYLNKVKFSNQVLQQVICLMSLTRKTSGRGRKRRGRVSYAQLGINQLGAVYEALLSYRGFFAHADLYEVKKAKETPNDLETGYFVTAEEISDYKEDEKVYDIDENKHKALRLHPKGKFIYRQAGRDRQRSASYYTPEVLTQCLVKYTLKERLKDLTADEILNLTICEPAMGSAAFLNEAVNQLSEAYLTLKQQELNKRINHEDYREALQQVKMHIADHNVYGVDLNPVAVELAEVSLWLNSLSKNNQVPWFGYQLFNGNSLIGARRQVYRPEQLTGNKKDEKWYKHEPKRLDPLNPNRDSQHIFHFLLPDEGMAGVKDKEAKNLKPKAFETIKNWKNQFLKPFDADEIKLLQQLSSAIDELWQQHTQMLRADRGRTEDQFAIWGQEDTKAFHTSTQQKDQIRSKGIFNNNAKIASSYRRLKLVMDYWCALWFWPIDQVDLLPERSSWLFELNLILQGEVYSFQPEQADLELDNPHIHQEGGKDLFAKPVQDLFAADEPQLTLTDQEQKAQQVTTAAGELHLEKLMQQFPRLKLVNELSQKYKFFHWELTFADVFANNGGFDIMLGNPPWLKVEWNEAGVLGDYNPQFVLRKLSAIKLREEREQAFERNGQLKSTWFNELEEAEGVQNFLNAFQNYPELKGIQTNLYKCFIPQSWRWVNINGMVGFLHPDGVYDDAKGGDFRKLLYPKLRHHYQFLNVKKLFSEILHWITYSINIYSSNKEISFCHISNIFHPSTIDASYGYDGDGLCPALKTETGEWDVSGHKDRLIYVDIDSLTAFRNLYDSNELDVEKARLPVLHSNALLNVLEKISGFGNKLDEIKLDFVSSEMWHETGSQKKGILKRDRKFPECLTDLVISGPNFFICNPFYKTPNANCSTAQDYAVIDSFNIPEKYLPRTNFSPTKNRVDYLRQVPRVPWDQDKNILDYYKLVFRGRINPATERSLISAIYPGDVSHIHSCRSYVFNSTRYQEMLVVAGLCASLVFDFYIKTSGRTGLQKTIEELPYKVSDYVSDLIRSRVLMLNCRSLYFQELWDSCWDRGFEEQMLVRLSVLSEVDLFSSNPFSISDYMRRQLLLEIDVLVSIEMGLTLKELLEMYRIQFPVFLFTDSTTYFDAQGRITFSGSRGLVGIGLDRKSKKGFEYTIAYPDGRVENKAIGWEDICPDPVKQGDEYGKGKIPDGTKVHRTVIDDTLPGGPREKIITYVAPFYLPNREEDYRVAWEVFTERLANEAQDGAVK